MSIIENLFKNNTLPDVKASVSVGVDTASIVKLATGIFIAAASIIVFYAVVKKLTR